jgi:hypothetical protein
MFGGNDLASITPFPAQYKSFRRLKTSHSGQICQDCFCCPVSRLPAPVCGSEPMMEGGVRERTALTKTCLHLRKNVQDPEIAQISTFL